VPPEAFYVARTMQVLELLAFQPLSAPQVAATLQIHPRTARRVLVRLHDEGYLTRSDDTRRLYAPSMRIVALAGQVTARAPLAVHGVAAVEQLHAETGADAHVIVPSYLSALCVVHADDCGVGAHPRELVPAHCTAAGKALLAWRQPWRDSVLAHALERRTARTIVDPAALSREADAIRVRGYATEDGELEDGVRAVAGPVFVGEDAAAALSVSGPDLDVDALAGRVLELADDLTAAIASNHG
jgi:IclR family transcriptional regulator, KDG regulon repressor